MAIPIRKSTFKTLIATLILITFTSSLTYQVAKSTYTSQPVYVDALPSSVSYLIETDHVGNYRAIKSDGSLTYEDTNASTVIQAAIDACPSDGGTISIKEGSYYVKNIIPKSGLRILGISKYATCLLDNSNTGQHAINWDGTEGTLHNFEIGNMRFEDAGTDIGDYIHLENVQAAYIHDIAFYTPEENAIYLKTAYGCDIRRCRDFAGGKTFISLVSSSHNYIADVQSGGMTAYGLQLNGSNVNFIVNFDEENTKVGGVPIYLYQSNYNVIVNPFIATFPTKGVYIDGTTSASRNNQINHGTIGGGQTGIYLGKASFTFIQFTRLDTNSLADITVTANAEDTVISDVILDSKTKISNSGIRTKVSIEVGYVTENSGTAIILASTSVTFKHGLASTPTLVLASFSKTGWRSWKWSANSTHVTITVEIRGTYTVYWYAEYKP